MLHRVSECDGFFGTTQAMENGFEICNMDYDIGIDLGEIG
jgi:hypothetical protein